MKHVLTSLLLASAAFPATVFAAPPEGFEARVEALRRAADPAARLALAGGTHPPPPRGHGMGG